jgi:hypothetical protein
LFSDGAATDIKVDIGPPTGHIDDSFKSFINMMNNQIQSPGLLNLESNLRSDQDKKRDVNTELSLRIGSGFTGSDGRAARQSQ